VAAAVDRHSGTRAAAFILAFVPIPENVPEWAVRAVWIALAVTVPALVGFAFAAKRSFDTVAESALVRIARGCPTTLALSLAFWISAVTVPLNRLSSIVRRREDAYVPLITNREGYAKTAARIERILDASGFELVAREPSLSVRAPMTVLRTLAGAAFRDNIPERLASFVGPAVEVVLYPNCLLLRGEPTTVAYAHGLVVEGLTPARAFQTTVGEAQDIERQIRDIRERLAENPAAHVESMWLRSRLDDVVGEIASPWRPISAVGSRPS
jgi:hypothetical protein